MRTSCDRHAQAAVVFGDVCVRPPAVLPVQCCAHASVIYRRSMYLWRRYSIIYLLHTSLITFPIWYSRSIVRSEHHLDKRTGRFRPAFVDHPRRFENIVQSISCYLILSVDFNEYGIPIWYMHRLRSTSDRAEGALPAVMSSTQLRAQIHHRFDEERCIVHTNDTHIGRETKTGYKTSFVQHVIIESK